MVGLDEERVGSVVEGTVVGIAPFGAFVTLSSGQTGLVHISEVAHVYVRDVRDHLQEQATVRVKILGTDAKGKLALSIKQAEPSVEVRAPRRAGSPHALEDKLARFMKESEERLTDLRRLEGKRGGRGGRHG